jgi:hypothetical protein
VLDMGFAEVLATDLAVEELLVKGRGAFEVDVWDFEPVDGVTKCLGLGSMWRCSTWQAP